jgi:hypothetical protein
MHCLPASTHLVVSLVLMAHPEPCTCEIYIQPAGRIRVVTRDVKIYESEVIAVWTERGMRQFSLALFEALANALSFPPSRGTSLASSSPLLEFYFRVHHLKFPFLLHQSALRRHYHYHPLLPSHAVPSTLPHGSGAVLLHFLTGFEEYHVFIQCSLYKTRSRDLELIGLGIVLACGYVGEIFQALPVVPLCRHIGQRGTLGTPSSDTLPAIMYLP